MLKKIIKPILFVLFGLATLIGLVVFIILAWPQTLINPTTLNYAAGFAHRLDMDVKWEKAQVGVNSAGLLQKKISLSFDNACFDFHKKGFSGCFDGIDFSLEYSLKNFKPRILALGPVLFEGGEMEYQPPQQVSSKEEKKPKNFALKLPEIKRPHFLRDTKINGLSLNVRSLKASLPDKTYEGAFVVSAMPDFSGYFHEVLVEAGGRANEGMEASARFHLQSPSSFLASDFILRGGVKALLAPGKTTRVEINSLTGLGDKIVYAFSGEYSEKKLKADLKFLGELSNTHFLAQADGRVDGLHKQVPGALVNHCVLELTRENEEKNDAHANLNCPIKALFSFGFKPSDPYNRLVALPPSVDLLAKADIDTFFYPDSDKKIRGDLEVSVKPFQSLLATVDGKFNLNVESSGYPRKWETKTSLNLKALFPEFQRIVQTFSRTPFAVFAPFHALRGPVKLELKGEGNLTEKWGQFPLELSTRLESKDQKFYLDSKGQAELGLSRGKSKTTVSLELVPSDIQILLPDFKIGPIPALFPDGRMKNTLELAKAERKASSSLDYVVSIKSPKDKPIRILSNHASDPIPLFLDLILKPGSTEGSIEVGKFGINFFKRDATLDRFKLTLAQPRELSEVRGRVSISYADYLIKVIVRGALKKPQVVLQSDPPLDEEQIISVLIYGEPLDNLDTENTSNVGNMAAALTDRAVSLASLYMLASTPIQRIGYDPQTRQFSAKVKLGKGTSLNVGSNWSDFPQLGLRKKLGKNWYLTTSLEPPTEDSEEDVAGSALLEWSKRY